MGRFSLAALIIVVASIVAAACRGDAPVPPRKGGDGTLRVATAGEPRTMNPNLGPLIDEMALLVAQNLFGRLIVLAADGSILPDLAERWEQSGDGRSYTFHLRRDVKWHDGRPFTAEDVRTTMIRVREESSNEELARKIEDIRVDDPHTVTITLKTPWAAFIPMVAWYGAFILPAHVYGDQTWTDHPANLQPIGTGPFKFESWERGRRIVFAKFDGYYAPGPYVDAIEYQVVRDANEGTTRVLDGSADLMIGRPPTSRLQEIAEAGDRVRVFKTPGDGRTYLAFNMRRPPFDDVRVRRAVNMAIDRHALLSDAYGGIGAPAIGFYTPAVAWAYNGEARVPAHDLNAARRVLSALSDSEPVLLTCLTGHMTVASALAAQLGAAGLHVRPEPLRDPQQYFARIRAGHFDLTLLAGTQGPDPDNLSARFATNGSNQPMGYHNDALDAELARGARETDVAVRMRAYHRAQEILAEDLPIAPLIESVRVSIARRGLRGLPQEDARSLMPDFMFTLVRRREVVP